MIIIVFPWLFPWFSHCLDHFPMVFLRGKPLSFSRPKRSTQEAKKADEEDGRVFLLGKHHLIWGKHWRIWCVVWWRRGTDSANCDLFMLKMLKEIAMFMRKILEHVEDNVENCDGHRNGTNMETDWKHGRETMGKILMIHGRTCKKHLRNLIKPQLITAFFWSSMVPTYVPVRSCKCWFNRFIPWKIWNIAERIDESRTHQLQFLVIYCRL